MKLNIDKRHLLLNSQEPTTLKIGDYPPLKKSCWKYIKWNTEIFGDILGLIAAVKNGDS